MKKILSILLAAVMLTAMLAGCTKTTTSDNKTTNLLMYVIGEEPADYDEVRVKLNEMLLEDINARVDIKFIAWSDVAKRYPVIVSSGEEFDLIVATTSGGVNFYDLAQKGAYMDITELAPKYAPKTYKEADKNLIRQATVDGKLYHVPVNRKNVSTDGLAIRGDLRKKYGIPEIRNFEGLMAYMKAIKENEPDMMPFNASKSDYANRSTDVGITGTPLYISVKEGADPLDIKIRTELEDYIKHLHQARECYVNGYWSKDVLMNTTPSKDVFINGTSAIAGSLNLNSFNALYNTVKESHPDWEPEFYVLEPDIPSVYTIATGLAVSRTSKNPEKALQLVELLNQDERYFNLTTYGIEGKHWVYTEDGKKITYPEGVNATNTGFTFDNAGNWSWRNDRLFKYSTDVAEGYEERLAEIVANGVWSPAAGFVPDVSEFKTEIAMINEINAQYAAPLGKGTMDDVDKVIAEWDKKLKDAGIEKIRDSVREQFKAYLEANK